MKLGDKLKQNFAKNLQSLRNQKDLTQARLADALNEKYREFEIDVQRTSIVNYEKEGAMPRIDALYCIADYFGKTIDQIISPTTVKPALTYQRLAQEITSGPDTSIPTSGRSGQTDLSEINKLNIDSILTTCVNGIQYRQFYVEVLKELYTQLKKNAGSEAAVEQIETMFSKTFLGCLISKSKYLQDLAKKHLDQQQCDVFIAFQDHEATIPMVAKAHGLTEDEVISVFNTAQCKISSALEGNSKTNLS